MAVQILDGEDKIKSVANSQNIITLTNKRVIFNDNFIKLSQLNGVSLNIVKVNHQKFATPDTDSLRRWSIIVTTIIFFIGCANLSHPYTFEDYLADLFFAIIGGIIFGSVLTIPLILIIGIYLNTTSTVSDKAYLKIQKIDNSYFVNNYFDVDEYAELRALETEINNHIFR